MVSVGVARCPLQSSSGGVRPVAWRSSPFFKGHSLAPKVLVAQRLAVRQQASSPQALFKGGGGARTAAKQAYICKDCGYIYDGRESFESLDKSTYACPVCNAPKRRFGPYNEPVSRGANATATRKARKADLQSGSGGGAGLNPGIVVGVGLIVVVAAFAYLNSVY